MPKRDVARKGKARTPPSTPNNSTGAKKYRKFSPNTAKIRDSIIDSTANDAIEAKKKNIGKDGKSRLPSKWMKNSLEKLNKVVCEQLKFSKDDIMNRMRKKEKEQMETNEKAEAKEEAKKQSSKKQQPPASRSSSSHETMRSAVEVSLDNGVSPSDTNVSSLSSSSTSSKDKSDGNAHTTQREDEKMDISPQMTTQISSVASSTIAPRQLDAVLNEAASNPSHELGNGNELDPNPPDSSLAPSLSSTSPHATLPALPQLSSSFLLDSNTPVSNSDKSRLEYPMRTEPRDKYYDDDLTIQRYYRYQAGEIIARHPLGRTIMQQNFSRLHPNTWVDDEVIHFFLKGILECETGTDIAFYSTHFMTELLSNSSEVTTWHRKFARSRDIDSIFDLEKLFIPINVGNTHWIFVMVDMKMKQIGLWDSCGKKQTNEGYLLAVQQYLHHVHEDDFGEDSAGTMSEWCELWSIYDHSDESPRQTDGNSCAIFVMLSIQRLAHGLELSPTTYTQDDIYRLDVRLRIALLISEYFLPAAYKSSFYRGDLEAVAATAVATATSTGTGTTTGTVTDTATGTDTDTATDADKGGTTQSHILEQDSSSKDASDTNGKNRGGRPKNSTNAEKVAMERAKKEATNWVVTQYAVEKQRTVEENKLSSKRVRVATGYRAELVKQAKVKFKIKCKDFDVPLTTIESRINVDRLEVWNTGDPPPIVEAEVSIVAMIIQASELKTPLSVGDIIHFSNSLIEGTHIEEKLIAWKRNRGMSVQPPLLGTAWYRGMVERNKELLSTQKGEKYATNREERCTYQNFEKMYDNVEEKLIESGNAVRLDRPVHMDKDGNIVEDSTKAFGRPVNVVFKRPKNVFVFDETGCNTHGKADKAKGGEKKVVARGQRAQEITGTKDCHFTVVPFTNMCAMLVLVAIIFPGKELHASWCIGEDPFVVEIPGEDKAANVGRGKRYPGMSVFVDGKEVPIYFAASPSASMDEVILTGIFAKMDALGITERGIDEEGNEYYPFVLLDGHGSRLGPNFTVYINKPKTKWLAMYGVPDGTNIWQTHDDSRQNGSFKLALYDSKSKFINRKRAIGLPVEIRKTEIVIVAESAITESFNDQDKTKRALQSRGWNPLNRATLDDPEILRTAPEEVRTERRAILAKRGVFSGSSIICRSESVVSSDTDLLKEGSGRIVAAALGQEEASNVVNFTASNLNYTGATARSILAIAKITEAKQIGREKKIAEEKTSEQLLDLYKDKEKRLTSGLVFEHGNGVIGKELTEAVVTRHEERKAAEKTKATKKKKKELEAKEKIQSLRREIQRLHPPAKSEKDLNDCQLKSFTLANLKTLLQYKKLRKDGKCPTSKPGLIKMLRDTWNRSSPNPSPYNSDVEADDEDEASEDNTSASPPQGDDDDNED